MNVTRYNCVYTVGTTRTGRLRASVTGYREGTTRTVDYVRQFGRFVLFYCTKWDEWEPHAQRGYVCQSVNGSIGINFGGFRYWNPVEIM